MSRDLKFVPRPEVAVDAYDVVGPWGLTIELTVEPDGRVFLHGLSGATGLYPTVGLPMGDCEFVEWVRARFEREQILARERTP